MRAIYKRELQAYFKSPVAYCVIGFFLALVGLYFWNVNLYYQSIEFTSTLSSVSTFLVFFAPVITMRLLSDEKKNGTEVLLRTAPIQMWKIVLGKYFAAYTVYAVMTASTIICPILMAFFVNDGGVFPLTMTICGYIGFLLLGAVYIAVGTLASSLTESQPIAAILGMVILIIIVFMESIGTQIGGWFGNVLVWISLSSRFGDFTDGLLNMASVFYYLSFTAVVLFITIVNLDRKRWN